MPTVQTVWIREEHQLLGGASAQTFATLNDANAAIARAKKLDSRVAATDRQTRTFDVIAVTVP